VDNFLSLEKELKELLNHEVDIVTEETLENPYFIKVVNQTKTPIYE
jgi:predicted nucleotidyltransferase